MNKENIRNDRQNAPPKENLRESGIKVLSLFDGISCGRVALESAGIKVKNYYASEVDPHAICVTQANYPDTVQIGCVKAVDGRDFHGVDLLIGGSPCKGFSSSGKGLGFADPRSKLFFEFPKILRESEPRYWLFENVVMRKESRDVITKELGVEPVELDSSLTSAGVRKRLYWANFPISEPADRGVKLGEVIEDIGGHVNKASIVGRKLNSAGKREDNSNKILPVQCLEVRPVNRDKSNCLTTASKDTVLTSLPVERHINVNGRGLPYRYYTKVERCRLLNLPDDYCDAISENQTVKVTGEGWEVGMIAHIFTCMAEEADREA